MVAPAPAAWGLPGALGRGWAAQPGVPAVALYTHSPTRAPGGPGARARDRCPAGTAAQRAEPRRPGTQEAGGSGPGRTRARVSGSVPAGAGPSRGITSRSRR